MVVINKCLLLFFSVKVGCWLVKFFYFWVKVVLVFCGVNLCLIEFLVLMKKIWVKMWVRVWKRGICCFFMVLVSFIGW